MAQQYFIRWVDGRTLCVDVSDAPSVDALSTALLQRLGHSSRYGDHAQFYFVADGRVVTYGNELPPPDSFLSAHMRLPGGKGGFGANLRSSGRTAASQRVSNFGACRDLNGRRLKSVNDEIRLRKWLSEKEAEKRTRVGGEYREASGPSGLPGWFLGVPTWAEGYKQKATGELVAFGSEATGARPSRRKTVVCRSWLAARAARPGGAPAGAPRWWGCPRGRACEYAHGEEELRSEAKMAAAASRREAAAAAVAAARDAYTSKMYVYGTTDGDRDAGAAKPHAFAGRSMLESVMQGMAAAAAAPEHGTRSSKRPRLIAGGDDDDDDEAVDEAPLPPLPAFNFNPQGWVVVVGGMPSDVSVEYMSTRVTSLVADDAMPPSPCATDAAPDAPPEAPQGSDDGAASVVVQPSTTSVVSDAASGSSSTVVGVGTTALPAPVVAEVEGIAEWATVAPAGVGIPWASAADAEAPPPRFYYEVELVELVTGGVVQLGWAAEGFAPNAREGDGVGDVLGSWAYDGARCLKWSAGEGGEPYGRSWAAGDVVGVTLELLPEPGQATPRLVGSFSLNGEDLGIAFDAPPPPSRSDESGTAVTAGGDTSAEGIADSPVLRVFPAVSIEMGVIVRINLGPDFAYARSAAHCTPVCAAARRADGVALPVELQPPAPTP